MSVEKPITGSPTTDAQPTVVDLATGKLHYVSIDFARSLEAATRALSRSGQCWCGSGVTYAVTGQHDELCQAVRALLVKENP